MFPETVNFFTGEFVPIPIFPLTGDVPIPVDVNPPITNIDCTKDTNVAKIAAAKNNFFIIVTF